MAGDVVAGHRPALPLDIDNSWVIDDSIQPAVTSLGPHATIVMLGHRAAEFVE